MHRFEPVARYCSLLSVITSPYCTAMLPIKFSWKLLPNSMSIWLFPRAQAEENLLSQTCPLALLFGAFLTRSGSLGSACSAPEAPSCCPAGIHVHNATANLGVMSQERSRFPALHHPVWAQQSTFCTSEFPWKKPSPRLLPPTIRGGKQTTNEAVG